MPSLLVEYSSDVRLVKAFEGLDGDGFVSIDQVRRRFPSVEICKSLVQPSPVEEQGEGEDYLLPVICMG